MVTATPPIADAGRLLANTSDAVQYFCENYVIIEDRNRNPLKFKYNPAQEILHRERTSRDLIIKASQLGITTFYLAEAFKETILKPGTTSVIVAHEEFLTSRLLHRMDVMYNNLPKPIRTNLGQLDIPRKRHDSAHEKSFPDINSTFYIGTARAFVFGRGEPIHNFIGSEIAFWPDADRILVPTMQRVPLEGKMVLESTPNGEGNRFYDLVQEAIEGQGRWTLQILHWWLEPEYRIPINSPYVKEHHRGKINGFDQEEIEIIRTAGWGDLEADERIRWRRLKIEEVKHMFWQEFFEDIISCFVTTASPYYDIVRLGQLRQQCREPIDNRTFEGGHVKIWEHPDYDDPSPSYVIAVDPGQGKITSSVALVWRVIIEDGKIKHRHVATLSGLYDPQTFEPMVRQLAYYYRTAMIAPEANGHGLAFCGHISDYPNLYRRTDVVSGMSTSVIGWATTGAARLGSNGTKTYMMSELNHLLHTMETWDVDVVRQLSNVRISAEKSLISMGGDDFHDAAAIYAATCSTAMPQGNSGLVYSYDPWARR